MKPIRLAVIFGAIVLVCYSILILYIEYRFVQDEVRHYLGDIEGPRPFYAINTSLSVLLLACASLVFLASAYCIAGEKLNKKRRIFYIIQFLLFAYLALDDRFMIHKHIGPLLGVEGDYLVIGLAIFRDRDLSYFGQAYETAKTDQELHHFGRVILSDHDHSR
jgi:hypothetical protein